jgi:hypothetical protein
MTPASVAVTLSALRSRTRWTVTGFALIAAVFVYTTIANIVERPDDVRIATLFILAIIVVSLTSRIGRSFELRATQGTLDPTAAEFIRAYTGHEMQLVAHTTPTSPANKRWDSKSANNAPKTTSPPKTR